MNRYDIHEQHPFFEYVRLEDSIPEPRRDRLDVALLDMNHSWPNVGLDALVHLVVEAAEPMRDELVRRGLKLRVLSFDVRRRNHVPEGPPGRFQLYIGTGGPGHLDPRLNHFEHKGASLLHTTGANPECASHWGDDAVYDMVGNLDEWVDDEEGVFLGGFYARNTREGCLSRVSAHPRGYCDYSLGIRCCQ